MTYKELADYILNNLTKEQQAQTATFYSWADWQYYPMNSFEFSDDSDGVLDVGHAFLSMYVPGTCVRCGNDLEDENSSFCDYCNYTSEKSEEE